jgi:Protein of unknown function (DUF3995)
MPHHKSGCTGAIQPSCHHQRLLDQQGASMYGPLRDHWVSSTHSRPRPLPQALCPMKSFVPLMLISAFAFLALVHLYWALGGARGKSAAIPHVHGRPAFRPSSGATLVVAFLLATCALLVASVSGLVSLPVPHTLLAWFTYCVALVLLLRAVGDFRLVGFFKRERGGSFARLDTLIFSPLCLLLALGVFFVGHVS